MTTILIQCVYTVDTKSIKIIKKKISINDIKLRKTKISGCPDFMCVF